MHPRLGIEEQTRLRIKDVPGRGSQGAHIALGAVPRELPDSGDQVGALGEFPRVLAALLRRDIIFLFIYFFLF